MVLYDETSYFLCLESSIVSLMMKKRDPRGAWMMKVTFFSRVLALNRECLNQRLFRLKDSDFPIGFLLLSTLALHKSKSFDLVMRLDVADPVTALEDQVNSAVASIRVYKARKCCGLQQGRNFSNLP